MTFDSPRQIHVAAASDLQTVLPLVVERFREEEPGLEVIVTFGSSGQLARQIGAGAPFDLFLSANEAYVQELAAQHAVERQSVRSYAIGSLVLAFHPQAVLTGGNLDDIVRPEIRKIAIANPELAPYGAAARQVLKQAGHWENVEAKLVFAATVRQALQFVETGNAEAGLVGRSTALKSGARVVEIDPALHDPIVQCLGVVARSSGKVEARTFARFLLGDKGRALLKSHGFQTPPAAPGRP
ncbi:MAG: molybdate ABC transporter substrate-binding protein [Isosphaeraceae bacterium]